MSFSYKIQFPIIRNTTLATCPDGFTGKFSSLVNMGQGAPVLLGVCVTVVQKFDMIL